MNDSGLFDSPYSPSWDANALNDADSNLCHEHKEEHHKVEGAVGPKTHTGKQKI